MVFGKQDEKGHLVHGTYLSINPGDFVDVKVVADISIYVDAGKRETAVSFGFQRVIQVRSRKETIHVRHSPLIPSPH